jgi:hypothetical protein
MKITKIIQSSLTYVSNVKFSTTEMENGRPIEHRAQKILKTEVHFSKKFKQSSEK